MVFGKSYPEEMPVKIACCQNAHNQHSHEYPGDQNPPDIAADQGEEHRILDDGMGEAQEDGNEAGVFVTKLLFFVKLVQQCRTVGDADDESHDTGCCGVV